MVKKVLLALLLIGSVVSFRLINLLKLPLYLDEGIFIYWAKLISESANFAYVSLQDGKTPLLFWLIALFRGLNGNTLLIGRLLSVAASAVTVVSWMIIISKEFKVKYGSYIYALFFGVLPYSILLDRMAFTDGLLSALVSVSTMFLVTAKSLIEKKKIFFGLLAIITSGVFLGFSYMTKSTGRMMALIEVGVVFIWLWGYLWNRKFVEASYMSVFGLLLYVIYGQIVGFLKFGGYRFWGEVQNKEKLMTFTIPEIIKRLLTDPLSYAANLPLTLQYFAIYFGVLLFFLAIGIYVIMRKYKQNLWLLFYVVAIFFGVYLSARIIASRYFYLLVPAVLAISSLGISYFVESFKMNKLRLVVVIVVWLLLLAQSGLMVIEPTKAIYSQDDNSFFVNGQLTALGLDKVYAYIGNDKDKSIVGVRGIWGMPEGSIVLLEEHGIEAIEIFKILSDSNPVKGKCLSGEMIEGRCYRVNFDSKKKKYLYIVGKYDQNILSKMKSVELVYGFARPNGDINTFLYKVL